MQGAAFEAVFGMSKEKYTSLPPFRKPKVKAAAEARYKEKAAAQNQAAEDKAAAAAAAEEANFKKEAEKRKTVGDVIAKKGNEALLGASPAFLKPYSLILGPLKREGTGGFKGRYCAVFPSVRFPSIPASERFFFVFDAGNTVLSQRVELLTKSCRFASV